MTTHEPHPSAREDACAAELLCDRHPDDAVALRVIDEAGGPREHTYGELRDASERVAQGLLELGVGAGDSVATLMGKGFELVVTQLATWRLGAVSVPLFTAFGPGAIGYRLARVRAKVVVCDPEQRSKLRPSAELGVAPTWTVVVAGGAAGPGDLTFGELATAEPHRKKHVSGPDGALIRLFTSGTTGHPKGVTVPVRAIEGFESYLRWGLDLRPDDVYWNMADPGWAYGLYYAIVAPLAMGRCTLLHRPKFSVASTWRVLLEERVTNFATAPTVYRALRSSPRPQGELAIRHASSAGEPLNPELVEWSRVTLGAAIHDQFGQTELGMILANSHHPELAQPLVPGSMGHALPGWSVEVVSGETARVLQPGELGRLAVEVAASPHMWFRGYADEDAASSDRFSSDGRWYFTGDAVTRDADGRFHFSARDDDVILMAGYRIGPFDVESVLLEHPAVIEAAVVGVPDEVRGEVLDAFVVLRPPASASSEMAEELQSLVKHGYAAHAYPRRVHFVDTLPRTPSGKVQRFVLRDLARQRTGERSGL